MQTREYYIKAGEQRWAQVSEEAFYEARNDGRRPDSIGQRSCSYFFRSAAALDGGDLQGCVIGEDNALHSPGDDKKPVQLWSDGFIAHVQNEAAEVSTVKPEPVSDSSAPEAVAA